MRIAFRSRILTAALGQELVQNYQWSNFDTTLDRVIKEQPASWLPKEFSSYGDSAARVLRRSGRYAH